MGGLFTIVAALSAVAVMARVATLLQGKATSNQDKAGNRTHPDRDPRASDANIASNRKPSDSSRHAQVDPLPRLSNMEDAEDA